jgi:membrane protein YdbS with pleckstrin-like domain
MNGPPIGEATNPCIAAAASIAVSLMHFAQIALTPGARYLVWRFEVGSIS